MNNQGSNLADCGSQPRSVSECGSPLPLLGRSETSHGALESARGLAPSKIWRTFVVLWLLSFAFCLPACAQYSIDWHTIDGGGGTSTGGVYSVSGTIGQPDAGGPMTNGQYSVTGGFWALPTAVQVTGAPTLAIVLAAPGQATISWVPNTPGFVLQETWVLSPSNWTNSTSGATNPIVVPATLPAKFYRLFKP
jgi:hypothetical protein